jgi:hypothetical protein
MNKAIAIVGISFMLILIYMGWVVTTYKPEIIQNTTGPLPKKETRSDYELPTLSEQEIAVTDSLIKDNISTSEDISERKSVEDMIKRVDDILTGKVQQDTISFSYTIKAPEIILPWAN